MKIDIPQTFNRWLYFFYIYLLNYPQVGKYTMYIVRVGIQMRIFHDTSYITTDLNGALVIFDLQVGPRVPGFFIFFLYSVYINAFVRYGENKALHPFRKKGIMVMFLLSIFVVPTWKFWYTNQSLTEAIPCCSPWSIYSSWCQWFCCWICWLHNWIRPTNISTRQPLPSPFWRGGRAMLGVDTSLGISPARDSLPITGPITFPYFKRFLWK